MFHSAVKFKWGLYGLAAFVCVAAQMMIFQRIRIWGVMPFVYPLLACIPAMYEGDYFGTAFAIAAGVVCDSLLPGHVPCFYTLTMPLTAWVAGKFSREWLPAGMLCAYVCTLWAYAVHGAARCFFLWAAGKAAWTPGMWTAVREAAVTIPWAVPPVTLLFRAVADRVEYVALKNG